MWRDMRSFMEFLEERKDLVRIKKEVNLKYEISAVLRKMGKRDMPVALFERVKDSNMPVVGNLYATSKRVCQALGVPKDKIWLEYLSTIHDTENPVPDMIQSALSRSDTATTASAPVRPRARMVVPSMGSTAMSTRGGLPVPRTSPLNSMGA